jgi:hypothetical protein
MISVAVKDLEVCIWFSGDREIETIGNALEISDRCSNF